MSRYESEQKAIKEYEDCRLHYKIVSEEYESKSNEENLEKMKEALQAVGIHLDVKGDDLFLSIFPAIYIRTKGRNAGRLKKFAWNREAEKQGKYDFFRYSDIVLMMQTMKDQELAAKIGMPIATYYRHKKALKDSRYYQSLDLNKLRDKEYLESVSGNFSF